MKMLLGECGSVRKVFIMRNVLVIRNIVVVERIIMRNINVVVIYNVG